MLPSKLHIAQIERFHNLMKEIDSQIDNEQDELKKGELCRKYYRLTKVWSEIDNFIEFDLKVKLDSL